MFSAKSYHIHLYFDQHNIEDARSLASRMHDEFSLEVGKFHQAPVGPHPSWSCQLLLQPEQFGQVVPWLASSRGSVDVLIHPVTGDELADHRNYAMWLGKSYDLDFSALEGA